jgi:nitroreductase
VFDNTAEELNLRPKSKSKNMELFKAVHRSQHVQRNFDLTRDMPEDDIATIITSATQCPSKQNVAFYKLHVVKDRSTIGHIYSCCRTIPIPDNPQVLGNLVLVFEEYENYDKESINTNEEIVKQDEQSLKILEQDRFTALGIAIGYVNLVSSQLGYGTGCCSCILDVPKLKALLELKREPLLVMGIGYAQEGKNRRVHHLRQNKVFATRKKQPIEVDYTHY